MTSCLDRFRVALAEAAHPGVVLDVHPRDDPVRGAPGPDRIEETGLPYRQVGVGAERDVELVRGQRPDHQQPRLRQLGAQLGGLDGGRDREPGRRRPRSAARAQATAPWP